jgi:hypothetical protein
MNRGALVAKVIAVTDAFRNLTEVETQFGLSRSEDKPFLGSGRSHYQI